MINFTSHIYYTLLYFSRGNKLSVAYNFETYMTPPIQAAPQNIQYTYLHTACYDDCVNKCMRYFVALLIWVARRNDSVATFYATKSLLSREKCLLSTVFKPNTLTKFCMELSQFNVQFLNEALLLVGTHSYVPILLVLCNATNAIIFNAYAVIYIFYFIHTHPVQKGAF